MLKILVADDHEVVRQGLERILKKEFPTAIIETVTNGNELMSEVLQDEWDLVISDVSMPLKTGLDALIEIKRHRPKLPVLILTMHPEEQYAIKALRAGASGYLTKGMNAAEIITASRRALMGHKYVTPSLGEKLSDIVNASNPEELHETLSDRELQVLKLIVSGKSLVEISQGMSIAAPTVSTYRARILKKLHLTGNAELVKYALDHKLFI